jgi:hypothetical protein
MSYDCYFTYQNVFEKRIEIFEKEAYEKYSSVVQNMRTVELSSWFIRLLDNKIIPALKQFGFKEAFSWSLFQMAAPSWELIGPLTEEGHWFHPIVTNEIEEVKKGILLNSRRNREKISFLVEANPQDLQSLVNDKIHPKNIFSLLDNISTPWITLPRVYDHLEFHHSQYLMGYLKYLSKETNTDFKKIIARIITEFLGNYTLKFMNEVNPKDRILDALFYGYEAMFWKNLRNPPSGFEDMEIFENFFRWAKRFQNKFDANSLEKARAINIMEMEKLQAFPVRNAFGLVRTGYDDMGKFVVSLRHGKLGIEAVIRSFGIGGNLLKNMTDGLLPYLSVPMTLSALFRKIKEKISFETQETRKFIRRFLLELQTSYDIRCPSLVVTEKELLEQLCFVRPRVLSMIKSFIEAIC